MREFPQKRAFRNNSSPLGVHLIKVILKQKISFFRVQSTERTSLETWNFHSKPAKHKRSPLGDLLRFKTSFSTLALSPHHLVDDAGVALDDLHDLRADVFFDVVGHGDAVVAVSVHRDCSVDRLQE